MTCKDGSYVIVLHKTGCLSSKETSVDLLLTDGSSQENKSTQAWHIGA